MLKDATFTAWCQCSMHTCLLDSKPCRVSVNKITDVLTVSQTSCLKQHLHARQCAPVHFPVLQT